MLGPYIDEVDKIPWRIACVSDILVELYLVNRSMGMDWLNLVQSVFLMFFHHCVIKHKHCIYLNCMFFLIFHLSQSKSIKKTRGEHYIIFIYSKLFMDSP